MGSRRPHAVLHGRGRRQAPVSAVPPRARQQRRGRAGLRREGRALRRSTVARTRSKALRVRRRRTATPRARSRFIPAAARPSRRRALIAQRRDEHEYYVDHRGDAVLHPHQRSRPELPRWSPPRSTRPAKPTGASSCRTTTTVMLEEPRAVRRTHGRARARGRHARTCASPTCAAARVRSASRCPSRSTRSTPTTTRSSARRRYRFSYESLTTPKTWYDYDFATGSARADQAHRGARRLRSRALRQRAHARATAKDGALIPISLVYETRPDRRARSRCC